MRELQRSGGPSTAVAARNGVGFSSVEAFLVETGAERGTTTIVPGFAGRVIAPGDALSWVWFPERTLPDDRTEPTRDDLGHLWDATAFGLTIEFDDGGRLDDAVDQYGAAVDPAAQFAARTAWVDQWNRRTVSLDAHAGRTVVNVLATLGTGDGPALRGWLDDVTVAPGPTRASRPIDAVATTRGTQASARFSRGNNAPLVAVPHGGVFGLPMTDASADRWPYAYQEHNRARDNRPTIQAFATSHIPSPWMGDRGVFQVMPSPLADPPLGREDRALAFDHAEEHDGPHRYAVRLHGDDGSLDATMTAGEFALAWRFEGARSVVLDHLGTVSDVDVRREGDSIVVEALLDHPSQTPPHHVHLRVQHVVAERLELDDGELRGSLAVAADGPVDVLLGISTVSSADAAANLEAAGSFDAMLAEAERLWTEKLDTLHVEGASDDQLASIYSGLYRLFLYPNRAGETALTGSPHHRSPYGDVLDHPIRSGPEAGAPEIVEAALTTTNGFWDTYRTAWPLLGLLTPDTAGELAQGFVQHFLDGGWTPRWSAPGAEDVMTGTTSDTVFADLLSKGVDGFDVVQAYRSALRNATVPAPDARVGRKGILPGAFRGFVDVDTDEGMSWTLDAAINDWATSVLARALADRSQPGSRDAVRLDAEAEWFARRSLQYRNVFHRLEAGEHAGLGFFIGREADGAQRVSDAQFDPDQWGGDYTETNAWGTMFTAPHDGAGIAALHGGEAGLLAALAAFRDRHETGSTPVSGSYDGPIHEMTEARDIRMGMLGLSNQPAHHIPFFPMFAGHHDDAHRTVREAVDRLFVGSDLGQGYPGDEDNGEMSAWYVFVTIGLYPLVPASGTYVLVPPSVTRTELRTGRDGGATTVIEIANPEAGGRFIESVTVDGAPWEDVSIPHAVVARGAHIVFTLSAGPTGWASDSRPVSASAIHGFADTPADVLPRGVSPLTDDTGLTRVDLAAGESVDLPVDAVRVALYTVTVAEPCSIGWSITFDEPDGSFVVADMREDEVFEWPGQTRVFRIEGELADGGTMRFTATTSCTLTQLELVARDSGPAV
ncbi:GH92 family glycosyl hydrolase [Curtobacterium sp. RRHDQ10]|uniref:GH92 family glycosyl hydrolase n=1 Tax=Curtobacterium phyllosphaerae TaxID=3413379 RepID=UPI003BF2B736